MAVRSAPNSPRGSPGGQTPETTPPGSRGASPSDRPRPASGITQDDRCTLPKSMLQCHWGDEERKAMLQCHMRHARCIVHSVGFECCAVPGPVCRRVAGITQVRA